MDLFIGIANTQSDKSCHGAAIAISTLNILTSVPRAEKHDGGCAALDNIFQGMARHPKIDAAFRRTLLLQRNQWDQLFAYFQSPGCLTRAEMMTNLDRTFNTIILILKHAHTYQVG